MSSLSVAEPASVVPFYGALFGWQTQEFGPVTLFRLPGFVGGEPEQPVARDVVAVMMQDPSRDPVWALDFWVADADAAAATATARGQQVGRARRRRLASVRAEPTRRSPAPRFSRRRD